MGSQEFVNTSDFGPFSGQGAGTMPASLAAWASMLEWGGRTESFAPRRLKKAPTGSSPIALRPKNEKGSAPPLPRPRPGWGLGRDRVEPGHCPYVRAGLPLTLTASPRGAL